MKKTTTQEIQYLGQMLTATTWADKKRLTSIILRLIVLRIKCQIEKRSWIEIQPPVPWPKK
jgi:hypothetical protein